MPYITKEEVKIKRNILKTLFPEYKFSVTNSDYSCINVHIMSGPIDLLPNKDEKYEQINQFYIEENYKDFPEKSELLSRIYSIVNDTNKTEFVDGDYGSIPSFYVHMSIGKWDREYVINLKK